VGQNKLPNWATSKYRNHIPADFGQFWKDLLEKASEQQLQAALASTPNRAKPNLRYSATTNLYFSDGSAKRLTSRDCELCFTFDNPD
jgi:cephalosporin-C deacetylase-like acetyl esterase